jgi:C-methyltransferase
MTTREAGSSGRPAPYMRLAELLIGSRIALALRVVAERGIADILADGAKSAEYLSSQVDIPAPTLRRLLRSLSYVGVFQEGHDGCFANTDVSAYLRSGAEPSLREMGLILNDDAVVRGWQDLKRVLETGNPAFPVVNGQTFFAYVASDQKRSETMARYMKGINGPEGPRIAGGFPFGRFGRLIDVGGGTGHILADILRAHAEVEGALFELPRTAALARQFLGEQGLTHRCEVFAGDFLEAVTPGYDAYFIKSTLHDWDDETSVQVLRNCRNAMPPQGRVLVTEIVLEPGKPIDHPHRFIDMEMMVSFGGKERTAKEFEALLDRASLRLERIHPIEGSFFSIVEGSRV